MGDGKVAQCGDLLTVCIADGRARVVILWNAVACSRPCRPCDRRERW
jgi:hypothetical protein